MVTALLLVATACGDGDRDVDPEDPPATVEQIPDVRAENEQGEAPIFWRTTDPFESLPAGAGSKVVFRITNGYEEETLRIVAQPDAGGPAVEFEAAKVDPGDIEPPGAYYALNLDLSEPGAWQVTVLAGDDQVIIPFEVVPPES
jgi:hypothetical protein